MSNDNITAEIKKENKKALIPFITILIISMFGGAAFGMFTNFISKNAAENFRSTLRQYLIQASPYLLLGTTIVLIALALFSFIHYKSLYRKNPNDEALMDELEQKLNYPMIFLIVQLLSSFMFFGIFLLQDGKYPRFTVLLSLITFCFGMAANMILNQRIVDFVKSMCPEKKGSVYDFKFAKKWESSCDEGQLLIVYKSAYRAMRITNTACIILWVVLVMCGLLFSIGILPLIILMIVWFVQTLSFSIESSRLERTR